MNFNNGYGQWIDTSTNTSYIVPPNTVTGETTPFVAPLRYTSVAVSETGQYTAAVADAGGNWFSIDYAHDWLVVYPGFYDWTKIVSTADGVCLAATVGGSDGGVWIGFIPHLNPSPSPSVEPTTMSPTISDTAQPTEIPTATPTHHPLGVCNLSLADEGNWSAVFVSGNVGQLAATVYGGGKVIMIHAVFHRIDVLFFS